MKTYLKLVFALIFFIFVWFYNNQKTLSPHDCELDFQVKCNTQEQGLTLDIHASMPVMLETSNKVTINLSKPSSDLKAWLSGQNMQMGKIPIQVKRVNSNEYQLSVVPVICAEANMIWNIELEIELLDHNTSIKQDVMFETQR
ncbi:hypothetical protein [Catenovulum maritimum]|uniref:Uncharacterized protein n=1 Tax=Catenovulum maritimum TaxID=1513271 RepID=A0A0J8GUG1_9ALTE|nr:hypothetical protein [Catenovulum maritimum]KMT66415.1 hypothetical protein XM47_04120 [Catenovulum maritimum]